MSRADKLREVIEEARFLIRDGEPEIILNDLIALLADAGLLMPDIPNGLNLIGFERKGGGGGLLWDNHITTEALTKGYAAMFARLAKKEVADE